LLNEYERNSDHLTVQAYSDKTYVLGTIKSAYRHARLGKAQTHPVYLFLFDYPGENSIVTLRGYSRDGFGTISLFVLLIMRIR
jgi:hypothetical protein